MMATSCERGWQSCADKDITRYALRAMVPRIIAIIDIALRQREDVLC